MQSGHNHEMPDIKLPIFVEEGFFYIFLNNIGFLCSVCVFSFCFQDSVQLIKFIDDCDSISSVG